MECPSGRLGWNALAADLDGMPSSGKRDFAIIGLGLQKIPTNSSQ